MVPSTLIRPADAEQQATIAAIADHFAIEGDFIEGREIVSGHINSTFRATFEKPGGARQRYILQKINANVFKDPIAVMRNVECVTRHINWKVMRVKKDMGGQTLNLYPGRGGKAWIVAPDGGVWRCYNSIEGCVTYDIIENTRQAYQAAKAFGSFQDLVSDLPASSVEETIPDFHHTPKRYAALLAAIAADPHGRVAGVRPEIDFVRQREALTGTVVDLLESGRIPWRITHNDTKINNVMIDSDTDQAVCVIDLDTVMPGASLYDFGDMIRSATSPAAEDEQDLSKVAMQMPMFEALVEGYLDAANGFLNDEEVSHLVVSGMLITLETGIRFLTDHILGDTYFKVHHPGHNLDRCRTQFRLVECIEEQRESMEKFVRKTRKGQH
jgi:hypothetical protein